MAYATYEFYTSSYLGNTILEADFARLSERATEYINQVTFDRAATYDDTADLLKKACCAVAESYQLNENGGGVVSETVGKITRNYIASTSVAPTEDQRLYKAVKRYLGRTELLYLGVDGIET